MKLTPKTVIVASSVAGLCVVGVPATAAHAAQRGARSAAVGDSCLIGTFRVQATHISFTIKGKKVTLTGGEGTVDHISAAGNDRTVFTHTKPFVGTLRQHQLKVTFSGSGTASFHANAAHTKVTSGRVHSVNGIHISASYDGNTQKDVEHHLAGGTQHYTCTAKKLVQTSGGAKETEVRVSRKP